MDQQPTWNFLHRWNEKMDRMIEKICSRKWWLLQNKCTMCKRNKFLSFWYHCYYLLYLKPTHALLLNILSHPHFKTLKKKKKCFVKVSLKNPTCFSHYHLTILSGRLLYLVCYHFSACLLRHLHYSVCGCVYVSVCPVYLSVGCLVIQDSSRPDNPQTGTPGTHSHRHIQPHTE
jgi:hypothetical protein